MSLDERFMRRALDLAEQGRYSVSPNPMVGCVLVRDGTIIGEGWHRRAGEPHAEIEALRTLQDAGGATMYVTLEPCGHQGRTPPCTEALLATNLGRVVIAMRDPNELVDGKGIERLRSAGIDVTVGVLESEARRQNEKFVFASTQHLPFVLLKAAMTLDGKLATASRESHWITADEARQRSLALREEYDAILVGSGTVKTDNPRLTRRLGLSSSIIPWTRVILGEIPPDANVVSDGGETIVFPERVGLETILRDLYTRGIRSVIVEGGSVVLSSFIRQELWQKMSIFMAPMVIGGGDAPSIFGGDAVSRLTEAYRFRFDRAEAVGVDLMITAYP